MVQEFVHPQHVCPRRIGLLFSSFVESCLGTLILIGCTPNPACCDSMAGSVSLRNQVRHFSISGPAKRSALGVGPMLVASTWSQTSRKRTVISAFLRMNLDWLNLVCNRLVFQVISGSISVSKTQHLN